jgi:hypothetical protein
MGLSRNPLIECLGKFHTDRCLHSRMNDGDVSDICIDCNKRKVDKDLGELSLCKQCFENTGMVDIGTFGTHQESLGVNYLNSTLIGDITSATELIQKSNASINSNFIHLEQELLDISEREILIQFTELYYDGSSDFRLKISIETLEKLIGNARSSGLIKLMNYEYSDIILRRVENQEQLINFHTDHSMLTMQVVLNDKSQYEGCDLVFVTSAGFQKPIRNAGSATIHDNTILHGVTKMTYGVRYSLFFLRYNDKSTMQDKD